MNNKDILGYSDGSPYSSEPFIDINTPNGLIDMSNTGRPILANGVELAPYSGLHNMGTTNVREIPLDKFQGPLRLAEVGKKLTNFFIPKNIFNFGKTPITPMSTNKNFSMFGMTGDARQYNLGDWKNYVTDVNNLQMPTLPFSPVQTRSLSIGNALVNNTDKAGNLRISTLQNFTNNLDSKVTGAQVQADKLLLQSTIDDLKISNPSLTDKSKIPYSLFESEVNKNIIQFNPKLTEKYASVGMDKLGIIDEQRVDATSYAIAKKGVKNKTILWQNDKIGNPVSDNHFPTTDHGATYGHTRFFATDKKTFNILEIQSDEFQRPLLGKLKKADEYVIEAENKIKDKQYKIDNFVPDPYTIMPDNLQWQNYTSQAREEIKHLEASLQDLSDSRNKVLSLLKTRSTGQNAQIKALEKNHANRLFGETIKYAADNGFQTVRFPHASTVATIEGFGGGQLTLEQRFENPWTLENEGEFDRVIKSLATANTYGHTTIAKRHGPFVNIPKEVNSVYSMDNSPRITHEEKGWAPKKARKPRMDTYADDESYRQSLYDDGWTDAEIAHYSRNIGHWKNQHISLSTGKDAGKYTITVRAVKNLTGKDAINPSVEIPEETAKNLQSGTYHIQDDGSWKYVGELDNPNTMKYINDVRQINHIEKPYEKKPFDIFNYGGKNYKKDRNEFLEDGVTANPNYNKRALNKKGEPTKEIAWSSTQTILNKYTEPEFKKQFKSVFGKDHTYKEVVDEKGNIWYEFNLPTNWKANKGQIKAYKQGGEVGGYRLSKFNDGGGVDYSNAEEVSINGQTYYRHKVKSGDTKSALSLKYGLWNEQGILNSVNNKYSNIKDQPNYSKNVNRMWAGDYILVGGPEFTPHTEYSEDRGSYANSFSTIPEEEMWSAITAIGHIETGSKVKYTRPEGRKYKNTTDDPLYLADNHPFTGKYESGMDDAYGFVSSANALGRFGIKETLLDKYAKDVLNYKEGEDWRAKYLTNKGDQRKLMQYLITDVYPDEMVNLRHTYPEASSQYSDFELLSALHRGGNSNVREQLATGKFSDDKVRGDISIGGYTTKVNSYLNPDVDISNSSFFMKNNPAHNFFKNKPVYKFGGSTNTEEVRSEIIGDMLEHGAFLPKFKKGSEKKIQGALGDYSIKKSYDDNRRLPYIEYNSSEDLDNNRIYYDKDDELGNDDFDIIDVYSKEYHMLRKHNRTKSIIKKYKDSMPLSPTEFEHIKNLGLIDKFPKNPKPIEKSIEEINVVKEGVEIPIENINASKDLYNKTDGNNKGISLNKQIDIYNSLINGTFDQDEKLKKVKRIYDRLNSLYYNDAKASKMTVLDYMKSLNN
jgi:hypothetical protein